MINKAINRSKLFLLTAGLLLCFPSCNKSTHQRLVRDDWEDGVKNNINSFLSEYGKDSNKYDVESYVVFDFDNTCSIFDIEEQLAIYQLDTMSFAISKDNLSNVLLTGLSDITLKRNIPGYPEGSYQDWVDDISNAYSYLTDKYGAFTASGLSEENQEKIHKEDMWKEFATKMRTMYNLISDVESSDVAYPWITYWFTGMDENEVYNLAKKSCSYYKDIKTSKVEWVSPDSVISKLGVTRCTWTSGVQVSENIKELWSALKDNGFDVIVCSASASDVIRAAVDVFGLHESCAGLLAMTNMKDSNGKYINKYDYLTGYGCVSMPNGEWSKLPLPTGAQTQKFGKVTAISNAIVPLYSNRAPLAGFMDSTGDFNFCTEFNSLKLVVCFNRADRKVTDGGGLIAEIAMYQKNNLNFDLKKANENGDTLYLLQGRNENDYRSFRNSNSSILYNELNEKLFRGEENYKQLNYLIENNMSTKDALNKFAIKTSKDDPNNVLHFDYGFLSEYSGYHSR